jgi:uncharacterized protein YcbK (DUF882 family)
VVYGAPRSKYATGVIGERDDGGFDGGIRVISRFRQEGMTNFRYFTLDEFDCQETGENEIQLEFVAKLDHLRMNCGFPFRITSGYRSPTHSIEAAKKRPGTHAKGIASDIQVADGFQRMILVKNAIELGFTGIGVAAGFVHVDTREGDPVMWTY